MNKKVGGFTSGFFVLWQAVIFLQPDFSAYLSGLMDKTDPLFVYRITEPRDLEKAFDIRRRVFVEEQRVDEREEYDEFESVSQHYIALYNDIAVGVARWRRTPNGIKLERFAVLPEYRSKGVGSRLVKKVLEDLPQNISYVYLHAQLTAIGLYRKFGFKEEGEQFSEANILHYKMVLTK